MLAIGRCLMGAPELVMFDEPSLGLAPAVVQALLRTIRDLNRDGLTCVLSSRTLRCRCGWRAALMCWRMAASRSAGDGEALLADDRVRQAYLGL